MDLNASLIDIDFSQSSIMRFLISLHATLFKDDIFQVEYTACEKRTHMLQFIA